MPLPVVAIVGAPNVGKSTLFNRLIGRRRAIVSDRPGVTRDRIAADCDLFGTRLTLVDTGGVVTGRVDDLSRQIRSEALKAVEASDLILFMVDARVGITAVEEEFAAILRRSGKPILTVANKVDAASVEGEALQVFRLGLGDVLAISAEQGRGMDELVDRLREVLPAAEPATTSPGVPLAIIGRPNVGKSSLFNRIVHEDRSLVSSVPGTTRDPVDATFVFENVLYRIVDTAGIRRRARAGDDVEWVSVLKARQALQEAEIAIALVDGRTGVEHQDLTLLGTVAELRTPAILAVNKIDLLPGGAAARQARVSEIAAVLRFASYTPVLPISALTGEGIDTLLGAIASLRDEIHRRFATAELNRALEETLREKQPPAEAGRPVRFYYMTQVGGVPPRLAIFSNGRRVPATYVRFLEGRLRRRLGLRTSPLVLSFRQRRSSR